jgi:hypothetical protein
VVVMLVVLLRWGLVGVMTMSVTTYLGIMVPTSDWSAWHAQPGILCTVLLAAIAAYGYRAATPGRRPAGAIGSPPHLNSSQTRREPPSATSQIQP